jgi:hypothetical protein
VLDREELLTAGMTNPDDPEHLARPVAEAPWSRPETVSLSNDDRYLVWDPRGRKIQVTNNNPALCEDFAVLETGDPETVLRFVQRYGTLDLCGTHDLPCTHAPERLEDDLFRMGLPPMCRSPEARYRLGDCHESVERHVELARQFNAILRIALHLTVHADTAGPDWSLPATARWEPLRELFAMDIVAAVARHATIVAEQHRVGPQWRGPRNFDRGTESPRRPNGPAGPAGAPYGGITRTPRENVAPTWTKAARDRMVNEQSHWIAMACERWLALGDVRVLPATAGTHQTVRFGSNSLFGSLALQLWLAVSRGDGFAICHHCGISYPPSQRPRAGDRAFCPAHRGRRTRP